MSSPNSIDAPQPRATTRVLLVEDDPGDTLLVTRALDASYSLRRAESWGEAEIALRSHGCDVVLLDLTLPDLCGDELIDAALETSGEKPVVIITGLDDDDLALRAVQRGAQDYLVKGALSRELLHRTIGYAIERAGIQAKLAEVQKDQLALKDEFISHVSHELRTPLTAIYQFVGILRDGLAGELNPDQAEYVGIIDRNVLQLRDMIEDLMEVTRAETGKLSVSSSPFRLEPVLEQVAAGMRGVADEKGIALHCELKGRLPRVLADEGRVRQIVGNLITNALKFTGSGGVVTVGLRAHEADADYLEVSVEDTGCGISQEGQDAVFGRLHQERNSMETSRKGLGLGLYICRELVTRQGGEIWVDSELGRGSRFCFSLPCFSLERVAAPIIEPEDEDRPRSVVLVATTLSPLDLGSTRPISSAFVAKVQRMHRECSSRYMDSAFSISDAGHLYERCFILARTGEEGGRALVERLTSALERAGAAEHHVQVSVDWQLLEVPEGDGSKGSRVREFCQQLLESFQKPQV